MANPYRKGDTSPFRCMDRRAWQHLKDLPADPLRLILHLWFSEHSTPFGILDLPEQYVLHDLGWRLPRLRRAWAVLEQENLVLRDGRLTAIPLFLACNLPGNPNVLAGWRKAVNALRAGPFQEERDTARSIPSGNRPGQVDFFMEVYKAVSSYITDEGLAWLQDKINTRSPQIGLPKAFDKLSNSGAGAGAGEKRKEQEMTDPPPPSALAPPLGAAPGSGGDGEPDNGDGQAVDQDAVRREEVGKVMARLGEPTGPKEQPWR